MLLSLCRSQSVISENEIRVQDSPLLQAVKEGHVCVLDEVDKCPLSSLSSLRALIQGYIVLPDGRVVVSRQNLGIVPPCIDKKFIVEISPNFRLILLSNPGMAPFQGNNVLVELGSHVVTLVMEPPSSRSMALILHSYFPNEAVTARLADAFQDLLTLRLQGKLEYSYSLREAISVCKHLAVQPKMDLVEALDSVFSFERRPHTRRIIYDTFRRHGFQIEAHHESANAVLKSGEESSITHDYFNDKSFKGGPKHGKQSDGKEHVGGDTWQGGTGGSSTAGMFFFFFFFFFFPLCFLTMGQAWAASMDRIEIGLESLTSIN